MTIEELLRQTVEMGASDLHLKAGRAPTVRVDGTLEAAARRRRSTDAETAAIATELMPEWRQEAFSTRGELDFAIEVADIGRFRVNVYRQQGNVALAIRYVRARGARHRRARAPADRDPSRRRARRPRARDRLHRVGQEHDARVDDRPHQRHTRDAHIVTIEDPVEYRHIEQRCLISQREIGQDTESFRTALKMVLRQDPDVILIGEMRDAETVWAAHQPPPRPVTWCSRRCTPRPRPRP